MADKALLLGINTYKSVSSLRGCVNDVANMRRLLTETFGFRPEAVKALLDREVTKARARPLMRWLFEDASPGDRLVFHFSGHGSYTVDLDGDEADRRDELICLHDMDFNRKTTYLLDDELREWLGTLPRGAQLTVVLDNCHSGTGTRKILPRGLDVPVAKVPLIHVEATAARTTERGARTATGAPDSEALDPRSDRAVLARFVEPPPEIEEQASRLTARSADRGPGIDIVSGLNYTLLSACRADQTAADAHLGGEFNGAFTYTLCRILRETGPNLDRGELAQRLSRALAADRFDQVPQLEGGSGSGPLFGPPRAAEPEAPAEAAPAPTPVPDEPEPATPGLPPSPHGPPTGGAATGSELHRRLEELLAAYHRVLEAAGAVTIASAEATAGRAAAGARHLVYVHGICRHDAGYSDGWWEAMGRFTPSLRPGRRDAGGNRHEVLWSDIVRPAARAVRAAAPSAQEEELRARLVETLQDRTQRQALDAAPPPAAASASGRGADAEGQRALLGIPGLDCIGDFTQYLLDASIRDRVIGRFHAVVMPLLSSGAQVEIISHSWGTVVAYEGLRFLDAGSQFPAGSVRNFFTVGSALSIGEIKRQLVPQARDGRKPRVVRRWINLDARFDVVGGPLKGQPFAVDEEFLNLVPTGCTPAFLPQPACSHSSYFVRDNLAVNRDIFGRFIEG
ncbi:MAG TPA: caspase family protein [Isosphaeraceae bacterium]